MGTESASNCYTERISQGKDTEPQPRPLSIDHYLLYKRQHAVAIAIELFDKHVTVGFGHDETILSEEGQQVHRIDVLLASLVDAAEGIQHYERVILREHFLLDFALTDA